MGRYATIYSFVLLASLSAFAKGGKKFREKPDIKLSKDRIVCKGELYRVLSARDKEHLEHIIKGLKFENDPNMEMP